MPYLQPFIDPNTGATFPQSYVRITTQPQVDFGSNRIALSAARYASQTTYSAGFHPVQSVDLTVQGTAFATFFASLVIAAQASFNSQILVAADAYIGSLVTFSGAIPTP